jgi:hypothetical protein
VGFAKHRFNSIDYCTKSMQYLNDIQRPIAFKYSSSVHRIQRTARLTYSSYTFNFFKDEYQGEISLPPIDSAVLNYDESLEKIVGVKSSESCEIVLKHFINGQPPDPSNQILPEGSLSYPYLLEKFKINIKQKPGGIGFIWEEIATGINIDNVSFKIPYIASDDQNIYAVCIIDHQAPSITVEIEKIKNAYNTLKFAFNHFTVLIPTLLYFKALTNNSYKQALESLFTELENGPCAIFIGNTYDSPKIFEIAINNQIKSLCNHPQSVDISRPEFFELLRVRNEFRKKFHFNFN